MSSLILNNPWIYDFAAYDLWSKPLGLLQIASRLRQMGFGIHLIDCLDVHHPAMTAEKAARPPVRRAYGTGKYWRKRVPPPAPLEGMRRPYSRYGLGRGVLKAELGRIRKPAAILLTSLMTYWYPGVTAVIRACRKIHPGVPVILGGIYATLCTEHAVARSGADRVLTGCAPEPLVAALADYGILPPGPPQENERPVRPAFDLLHRPDYVCIMTSTGCPYRCRYCASPFLNPRPSRREPAEVVSEIVHWHESLGIRDIAFYDDALLVAFDDHLAPILEALAPLNLRFHTPNAVHAGKVTKRAAGLMRRAGFRTIRIGLETSDFSVHRRIDKKIRAGDFETAVGRLLDAGFPPGDIGAYILMGLPGQSTASVRESIDFVARAGAVPYLSEYSPIPHTPLWREAVRHSRFDLAGEPLFHNNTLIPCWTDSQREEVPDLKQRALEVRNRYRLKNPVSDR